ncbi:radical SAM protein [Tunturibacter empetritectus]|uniref:Cyclic dehypoxanthinyl futalosine synthase n=1 Tax=Tunturiibacter empetritectus TaxID=3069691 RepID=A0A7W8IKS8_9BACT|nr:radical SAM protein [Edaphobacter lichenicola]MBB5318977.1 cyclic dehypoxanthinyl futalosine synthase [Edaphobacter lichenicola]
MGISRNEALDCFRSDDLIGIGMEADAVRRRLHPEGVVSYAIDGRVTYAQSATGAGFDQLCEEISHIVERGGHGVMLQGEVTPALTISWFDGLFRSIKKRFPSLWLHSLSAGEILSIAKQTGATIEDTIARLHDAGLDSIPGDDAGILDDAVQQGTRTKWTTADWLAVHRAAHKLGMQTTATMTFGGGETIEHRVNHLEAVRGLQQETNGFASFTPWSFAPKAASMPGFEEATAVEYLKTLAISRMYLDNIDNVQSNLETQGLKVLQVGLRFGGNDVGSVLHAEGANAATEEQLRQVIRDAGFKPVQRDTVYRTMFLN